MYPSASLGTLGAVPPTQPETFLPGTYDAAKGPVYAVLVNPTLSFLEYDKFSAMISDLRRDF